MIFNSSKEKYYIPTISFYLGGTGIDIGQNLEKVLPNNNNLFEHYFIDAQLPGDEANYHRFLHAFYRDLTEFRSGAMSAYCNDRFPDFLGRPPVNDSNGGCGITRLFGSASLVNKREQFEAMLERAYGNIQTNRKGTGMPLQIFLTASTCGGTGAGMVIDAAVFIRQWFLKKHSVSPKIYLFLVAPDVFRSGNSGTGPSSKSLERMSASAYGLLKELSFYADGNDFSSPYSSVSEIVNLSNTDENQRVFDWVYWFNAKGTNGAGNIQARDYSSMTELVAELQLHLASTIVAKNVLQIMPNQRESRYSQYSMHYMHHDHKVFLGAEHDPVLEKASKTTFLSSGSVLNVEFPYHAICKNFVGNWVQGALYQLVYGADDRLLQLDENNFLQELRRLSGGYEGSDVDSLYVKWQLDPQLNFELGFTDFLTAELQNDQLASLFGDPVGDDDDDELLQLQFSAVKDTVSSHSEKLSVLNDQLEAASDRKGRSNVSKEYCSFLENKLHLQMKEVISDLRVMASDPHTGIGYSSVVRVYEQLIWEVKASQEQFTNQADANQPLRKSLKEVEDALEQLDDVSRDLKNANPLVIGVRAQLQKAKLASSVANLDDIEDVIESSSSIYYDAIERLKVEYKHLLYSSYLSTVVKVFGNFLEQVFKPEAKKVQNLYLQQQAVLKGLASELENPGRYSNNLVYVGTDEVCLEKLNKFLGNSAAITTDILTKLITGKVPINENFFNLDNVSSYDSSKLVQAINSFALQDQMLVLEELKQPWRREGLEYLLTDIARYLDQGLYPSIDFDETGVDTTVRSWLIIPEDTFLPNPFGHGVANIPRYLGDDENIFSVVSVTFGVPPNALSDNFNLFHQYWLHIGDLEPKDSVEHGRYPLHISRAAKFYDEPYSPIEFVVESNNVLTNIITFAKGIELLNADNEFLSPIRGKSVVSQDRETLDWNVFIELIHAILDKMRIFSDIRDQVYSDNELEFLGTLFAKVNSAEQRYLHEDPNDEVTENG